MYEVDDVIRPTKESPLRIWSQQTRQMTYAYAGIYTIFRNENKKHCAMAHDEYGHVVGVYAQGKKVRKKFKKGVWKYQSKSPNYDSDNDIDWDNYSMDGSYMDWEYNTMVRSD